MKAVLLLAIIGAFSLQAHALSMANGTNHLAVHDIAVSKTEAYGGNGGAYFAWHPNADA